MRNLGNLGAVSIGVAIAFAIMMLILGLAIGYSYHKAAEVLEQGLVPNNETEETAQATSLVRKVLILPDFPFKPWNDFFASVFGAALQSCMMRMSMGDAYAMGEFLLLMGIYFGVPILMGAFGTLYTLSLLSVWYSVRTRREVWLTARDMRYIFREAFYRMLDLATLRAIARSYREAIETAMTPLIVEELARSRSIPEIVVRELARRERD